MRQLRRIGALQLQRSTWLVEELPPELLKTLNEIRTLKGSVLISDWRPLPFPLGEPWGGKLDGNNLVGVMVNGDDVIYSGWAEKILAMLKGTGATVEAKLGGSMGKGAILGKRLQGEIEVGGPIRPSQVLDDFARRNVDLVILINHGRSTETGSVYGMEILENAKLLEQSQLPFIQIERPGEPDGVVIPWRERGEEVAHWLASEMKLKLVQPLARRHRIEVKDGFVHRTLEGVGAGELIILNDVIIGRSNSSKVTLVAKGSVLVEMRGGSLVKSGLSKVGKVDLVRAVIITTRGETSWTPPPTG